MTKPGQINAIVTTMLIEIVALQKTVRDQDWFSHCLERIAGQTQRYRVLSVTSVRRTLTNKKDETLLMEVPFVRP